MKKKVFVAIVVGICVALGIVAAIIGSADRLGGYNSGKMQSRTVCGYFGCVVPWNHTHRGIRYFGHYAGDGHNYH